MWLIIKVKDAANILWLCMCQWH